MSLELYQQECAHQARRQQAILDGARLRIVNGEQLSPLEENGVLHALQVLVENAIGKSKHLLKRAGEPVPTSAYDAFEALIRIQRLEPDQLKNWAAAIGLRNRIVHEYMNLDIRIVLDLVKAESYQLIVDFLLMPIN